MCRDCHRCDCDRPGWADNLCRADFAGPVIARAEDVADGAQTTIARLDDLAAWRGRAEAAVEELSGRTARRLVEALTAATAVGMGELAQRGGASPAAVCRNLAILAERGVAREISGQARYQVWTANV